MQYEHFDTEIQSGVAHIRLIGDSNPNLADLCSEFLDLMLRLQEDRAVRAILLTDGECLFDQQPNLHGLAAERQRTHDFDLVAADLDQIRQVVTFLQELIKPMVIAARGDVRGAGLGLFMAGDVHLAGSAASFTAPDVTAGLMPDWGLTFTLPRQAGSGVSLEFLWSGRTVSAGEAARMGLVDRVIPDASWDEELAVFMERLAHLPQPMVRLTKLATQQAGQFDLTSMLSLEFEAQMQCWDSQETLEGLSAWQEGRRPVFQAPQSDSEDDDA